MPQIDGFGHTLGGPQADQDVGVALTLAVMVVVTMPEAGAVARAGVNLQVTPDAMPPQPKLTVGGATGATRCGDQLRFRRGGSLGRFGEFFQRCRKRGWCMIMPVAKVLLRGAGE